MKVVHYIKGNKSLLVTSSFNSYIKGILVRKNSHSPLLLVLLTVFEPFGINQKSAIVQMNKVSDKKIQNSDSKTQQTTREFNIIWPYFLSNIYVILYFRNAWKNHKSTLGDLHPLWQWLLAHVTNWHVQQVVVFSTQKINNKKLYITNLDLSVGHMLIDMHICWLILDWPFFKFLN